MAYTTPMSILRSLIIEDPLSQARENLLLFLAGDSVTEGDVNRGELNLSELRLIEADVVIQHNTEVWYELHAQRSFDDVEFITFVMRAVCHAPLPATARLIVRFGNTELGMPFVDGQAESTWRLAEHEVIDRKNRRVFGPLEIRLDGL